MKYILLIAVITVFNYCYCDEEMYTEEYDNVNIDQILSNDRVLDNYLNCLMERGKCTKDGIKLKSVVKDALENGCSKCSKKQREKTEKVIRYLIENKPEEWNELNKKYDPEGIYRDRYEAEEAKLELQNKNTKEN